MSIEVTETLLEARYMPLIARCIADIYGAYTFQFYKPSPRDEVFLGFDQAWVRIQSIPAAQLYRQIRDVLSGRGAPTWYWAFFLQFKRVDRIGRNSKEMKSYGVKTPYFRSELSLRPNPRTRKSQHEILKELSAVASSEVYYACPMMFSRDDVYRDADPDELRLVEVSGAPAGYLANQKHHIVFRSPSDPSPLWCSEPIGGRSIALKAWIDSPFHDRFDGKAIGTLLDRFERTPRRLSVRHSSTWARTGGGFGGGNGGNNNGPGFEDDESPTGAPGSLIIVRAEKRREE